MDGTRTSNPIRPTRREIFFRKLAITRNPSSNRDTCINFVHVKAVFQLRFEYGPGKNGPGKNGPEKTVRRIV